MSDFNLIVSSLVLALLLPVSVAVLYALMSSHMQLSPDSAMHSAVVARFDSEAERAEYHAAHEAQLEIRRATALQRYRQEMERQLSAMDPREAEPYRRALAATASAGAAAAAPANAAPGEANPAQAEAAQQPQATTTTADTPRRRPALWRGHLTALRQ